MLRHLSCASFWAVVFCLVHCASAHKLEATNLTYSPECQERADFVKRMFVDAYGAYRRFAFVKDDLRPLSQTYANSRNGWGATLVDSLDTMQLMGLTSFYNEAVQHIAAIDFTKTKQEVNVFETTIRYVAGLLSAYELSGKRDEVLLDKAMQLADKLVAAWENSNPLPWTYITFDGSRPPRREQVSVASISLIPELRTLSKHTGNETYLELARKAQSAILRGPSSFPGLLPNAFWPPTGETRNKWVTWGSGSDSAHEYLLKHHLLTGDAMHLAKWKQAVESAMKHLTFTSTKEHHFLGEYDGKVYLPDAGHLTTFVPGNWLLGAELLKEDDIRQAAFKLLDSAWATHDMSPHGLGPDEYSVRQKTALDAVPRKHRRQAEKLGIYCTKCGYLLRPETIESNFYAWRLTGDTQYQERAWRFAQDLKRLQVDSGGFAGIRDVFANQPRRIDHTESFFYAETLKYLYLHFVPLLSLDHFVFNTEAHPFAYDDAPAAAFDLAQADHPLLGVRAARGASLHFTLALIGVALLVLLVHLVTRVRGRRARLPTLTRRRDGLAGTGGVGRRTKSSGRRMH